LERKEREKVFKDAGGIWDYDAFKKVILDRYEMKHELDCAMIERAHRNRQFNHQKVYIAYCPEKDQDGTDLFPEDCDEELHLDTKVDLQNGFRPSQPVLLATVQNGDYFAEYADDEKYEEIVLTIVSMRTPMDAQMMQTRNVVNAMMEVTRTMLSFIIRITLKMRSLSRDPSNVCWCDQPDGSCIPWQWYQNGQEWDCYLAYEPSDEEDEFEEAAVKQMADIYIATAREMAALSETVLDAKQEDQMRQVYIADTKAKRQFGFGT